MKSTLMKLKEKTKTWLSPKHQFYNESIEFRENYAAAILLQTQLSQEITPMDNFELLRLFTFGLHLGREEVKQVISYARNRERILENILQMLDTEKKQTVFLLDLYNMSYTGYGFGEKESEAIEIYGELFHFPKIQLRLLRQLIKEAMDNHAEECMKLYANMMQLKMSCTLENIRYYIPELEYTTVFDAHAVYPGKTIIINGQCEIREEVEIPAGCELRIENAILSFAAPIRLRGGKLTILDSELEYTKGVFTTMFFVEKESEVSVSNTQVYCRNHCGFLWQHGGNLHISKLSVYETNFQSAVVFQGRKIQLDNSCFQDCYCEKEGAAVWAKADEGNIVKCHFTECMAGQGGAVYAAFPVKIEGCIFDGCHARKLGNSIYYKGVAQGVVHGCIYEASRDERGELVQEIGEEQECMQLKEICYSTCFMGTFSSLEKCPVYAHDVHLYLHKPLRLSGGFTLEHGILKAYEMEGKDMLDVSNGSPVVFRDSVLDGDEKHGILKATGTKVTLLSCVVKNTAGGRAVYSAVDLLCEDTVFSNCLDGAVYGSRAVIRDSSFVNCRSDTGAGIYLAGNKGLIKNCEFERCIARINGGGISVFGNYPIEQCRFRECEPDDRG